MPELDRTPRSQARRKADRAAYDVEIVNAILDEALVCHVGFAVDGRPWVFPTTFGRVDDRLYIHGAADNFGLKTLAGGIEACVTVTLLDGLVLAKSAFHHSMNYRSVMLFGRAEAVADEAEKTEALEAIVEHMLPGRWDDTRWPTAAELRATSVLRLPIKEGSAKVRTGGPIDDDEDLGLPHWTGVVPVRLTASVPDDAPAYVSRAL